MLAARGAPVWFPVVQKALGGKIVKGTISEAFTRDTGTYFVKVADVQGDKLLPLDDGRREHVRRQLTSREKKRKYAELVKNLRKRAYIKSFIE